MCMQSYIRKFLDVFNGLREEKEFPNGNYEDVCENDDSIVSDSCEDRESQANSSVKTMLKFFCQLTLGNFSANYFCVNSFRFLGSPVTIMCHLVGQN